MRLAQRIGLKAEGLRAELLPNGAAAPLTRAIATVVRELRHSAANMTAHRRLLRAAKRSPHPLKVNLGCGSDVRVGWLNIDFEPARGTRRLSARLGTQLIRYDLRRGLSLPAASCTLIYSAHFLEHLELRQSLHLMRDCHRALMPGGVFRASLPDFRRVFKAYLDADVDYLALLRRGAELQCNEQGMQSLVDLINYSVYQRGEHRFIYDQDKIVRTLHTIGFSAARIVEYNSELDPSAELRRRYSFYVEAIR